MPTANRRRFFRFSLLQFLRQDYSDRELIVIDDGVDSVADLIPKDNRIRYVALTGHHSIGEKRNIACKMSRGEFIAHWDDDDWYASSRIAKQVEVLSSNARVDICGQDNILFANPEERRAWIYRAPNDRPRWLLGATLCYRRTYWSKCNFNELDDGEDTCFVYSATADQLKAVKNALFVGRVHLGNVSRHDTSAHGWRPCSFRAVETILGADWPAFENPTGTI
jgi:O-antigen biosynthesis protein